MSRPKPQMVMSLDGLGSSRGVRGPEGERETRHSAALVFGKLLKASSDAARKGDCRQASKLFIRARSRGRDLADALPNARREISAKIRMVERQLLNAECSTRKR